MSDFKAKKALGQNFISDPYIIESIVDASGVGPSDLVVEIGPGMGALTVSLSKRAKHVTAVELDREVIPLLRGNLAGAANVDVVNGDILEFDWSGVQVPDDGALRIVGNLPYYITTPILLGLLEKKVPADSITAMVQKEVAQRIVAPPGGRDYGVLSVSLQYYCSCAYVLDVPAEYFSPRPKVDSAVVNLTLKPERIFGLPEEAGLESLFFEVVKASFSKRRKTLLNSLTGFRGLSKEELSELILSCGIDAARRPETLSLQEFAELTRKISQAAA